MEAIEVFDEFMETVQATDEEKDAVSRIIMVSPRVKENNYIDQLRKQNPRWILEMIEVFRFELSQPGIVLEDFMLLGGVFERVLEWVFEGSSYLNDFEKTENEGIRSQVERYWYELNAMKDAVSILSCGDEVGYISWKVERWKMSGNLLRKKQVIMTINTIFRFSDNLDALPSRDLVQLLYYSLSEDIGEITGYFHERVAWVKAHAEELFYEERGEAHAEHLESAIWILGARILEGESSDEMALTRSMFFRYLYEACHSTSELLRNNAFNSLLFYQKNTLFSWDDLLKFSVPDLAGAIVSRTSVALKDERVKRFDNVGQLSIDGESITLSPYSVSRKPVSLLEVNGLELRVSSDKKIRLEGDFLDTLVSWKDVFSGYTVKQPEKETRKERPPVGTVVKIKIKNIYQAKPILAFASVVDDFYEGEGALHVSGVTGVRLETLESILYPGDVLYASVIETPDGRLQFSIMEEINKYILARYHAGEPCNALLLHVNEDLLTWVSEPGFRMFTKPAPSFMPEVGSFYLLEIEKIFLNGYIAGQVEMPSNVIFDRHEAVARLVRQYVNYCKSVEGVDVREEEDVIENDASLLKEDYIVELTRVLQLFMVSKNSVRNLNLLCFLKLIAHVLGDDKLKEYYACCIHYLTSMQVFINGEGRTISNFTEIESDFFKFPVLKQRGDVFKLLAVFNKREVCDLRELYSHVESHDRYLAKVAKLVLASKLVVSSSGTVESIRRELLELLSIDFENKEVEEEKIEFGGENGTREFKCSIVYPAEAQWQADVDKQVGVILKTICGFLNGAGGVLYIGVNDFGIPDGIKNDLDYLRCNTDKYELFLRKQIVEYFGGDVNGLIVIKFRYFGNAIVCAVSVPEYHAVVMLNGVVWQRQGNSTLVVTAGDLRLLKRRKKTQADLSVMANAPLFPGDSGYEL